MAEMKKLGILTDHRGTRTVALNSDAIARIEARLWSPGPVKLVFADGSSEIFSRLIRFEVRDSDLMLPTCSRVTHVLISTREPEG